jgi:DNA-binding NarL/FixJ family response regulator
MGVRIRIAILDDHQSIIDGYTYRLAQSPEVEVVASALFGEQLEPMLARFPVDVLLLDISVPLSPEDRNPFQVLFQISSLIQRYPGIKVVVISMHNKRRLIKAVMKAGASGYILKDDQLAISDLAAIVRSVANGGTYFSRGVYELIGGHDQKAAALSQRQIEALSLCAAFPDGTTAELAARMNVADSTFRNLLSGAYGRLAVRNRASAVAKARRLELIPDV